MPVFGQIWPFFGQKSIFWGDGVKLLVPWFRDFCWQSISPVRLTPKLSHSDHPKKCPFLSYWSFFGGHPCFWPFWGHFHYTIIGNLWTLFNETWWDCPGHQKMTQNDNGPGLGRNYGETAVFTFGRKVVFGLKMGFNPKNHPKYLFGKRHLFSFNNFFRL